jgi:hypothetical protein
MNPIEEKHSSVGTLLYSETREHAIITKETAMGFDGWLWTYCEIISDGRRQWREYKGKVVPTSELYDIYLESLKS